MKNLWRKVPKWIQDTLIWTFYMGVLVALYNWLGPLVLKRGMYFPWELFPYSIVLALAMLGVYNYAKASIEKYEKVQKQQAKQAQIKKAKAQQAQQVNVSAAQDRRLRNEARKNHTRRD